MVLSVMPGNSSDIEGSSDFSSERGVLVMPAFDVSF